MIKNGTISLYQDPVECLDVEDPANDGKHRIEETGTTSPSECMKIMTRDVIAPQENVTFIQDQSSYSNIFSMIERCSKEPEIPMICSGIKKGTFGFVYGPAKSGKTIYCENLGMSIAARKQSYLGMPLYPHFVNKVLFISMEEFWQNRTERNKKQLSALHGFDERNFNYMVVDEHFPTSLVNEKNWRTFEETIISSGADFVIVDSFTRMIRDEIEKSKVGSEMLLRLKNLTMKLKITLIVIHHSAKIINMPLDIANMAGSRVVGQEADFILGINRLSNGTRYFKEVSTRYKQENDLVTTFHIDDNLWLVKRRDVQESSLFQPVDHRENPENEELVFQTIQDLNSGSGEIKTSDIISQLRGTIGQTVIYGYLKDLEQNGLIDRSQKGYIKLMV
ncbi:MAG: AAA family ATPase [Bacteroidota bacterium]|nr:AAA family ATPase [Bacteroidota bacterium]